MTPLVHELELPEELINYIVNNFLSIYQQPGIPIVLGINPQAVETVMKLFFAWAENKDYLKGDTLNMKAFQE